jgi:N utilization substance protein B
VRGESILTIVNAEAKRAANEPDRAASWLYAREIVDGVTDHREEIDELIVSYAQGWVIDRMPNIDRALLRLAAWEILFNSEVPTAVAIDEAVELAKEYSTDDSGRFINGVLGRIAEYAQS